MLSFMVTPVSAAPLAADRPSAAPVSTADDSSLFELLAAFLAKIGEEWLGGFISPEVVQAAGTIIVAWAVSMFAMRTVARYQAQREKLSRPPAPTKQQKALQPVVAFLTELGSGRYGNDDDTKSESSSIADRRFFSQMHPALLREVERGVLRAIARAVSAQLGEYQSITPESVAMKEGTTTEKYGKLTAVVCKCVAKFSHESAHVQVSYGLVPLKPRDGVEPQGQPASTTAKDEQKTRPVVISFSLTRAVLSNPNNPNEDVASAPREPLLFANYFRAQEFEPFGKRFAMSLLTRRPDVALSMMVESLQAKYGNSSERLAMETLKVLKAAGGVRVKREQSGAGAAGNGEGSAAEQTVPINMIESKLIRRALRMKSTASLDGSNYSAASSEHTAESEGGAPAPYNPAAAVSSSNPSSPHEATTSEQIVEGVVAIELHFAIEGVAKNMFCRVQLSVRSETLQTVVVRFSFSATSKPGLVDV